MLLILGPAIWQLYWGNSQFQTYSCSFAFIILPHMIGSTRIVLKIFRSNGTKTVWKGILKHILHSQYWNGDMSITSVKIGNELRSTCWMEGSATEFLNDIIKSIELQTMFLQKRGLIAQNPFLRYRLITQNSFVQLGLIAQNLFCTISLPKEKFLLHTTLDVILTRAACKLSYSERWSF